MASISTAWADGTWRVASWATGAWADTPRTLPIFEAIRNIKRVSGKEVAYDFSAALTSGAPPLVFTKTAGTWPTGITLDADTGVASGTVAAPETKTGIKVTATNSDGADETNAFDWVIQAPTTGGGMTRMGIGV